MTRSDVPKEGRAVGHGDGECYAIRSSTSGAGSNTPRTSTWSIQDGKRWAHRTSKKNVFYTHPDTPGQRIAVFSRGDWTHRDLARTKAWPGQSLGLPADNPVRSETSETSPRAAGFEPTVIRNRRPRGVLVVRSDAVGSRPSPTEVAPCLANSARRSASSCPAGPGAGSAPDPDSQPAVHPGQVQIAPDRGAPRSGSRGGTCPPRHGSAGRRSYPRARTASMAPSSQMLCLRVSGITKMAIRNMTAGTTMG